MVETRRCNNKEMICENNKCSHKGIFSITDFKWNENIIDETFDCMFKPILIQTESLTKKIFNSNTNCKATNLYCQLYDSTVIWNRTIVKHCELEKIHKGQLLYKEQYNFFKNR